MQLLVVRVENIKNKIRTVPNWPKEGIMFRDITTLLQDAEGLKDVVGEFVKRYMDKNIDIVAGIEARGFILGGAVAKDLGVGFVPIRKKGKLPFKTLEETYEKEYGPDTITMHIDAIKQGQNILLIDDLLATGGTALAAAKLIKKAGGKVAECAFIVDLPDIGGRTKLEDAGYNVFTMVEFEGD